MQIEHFSHILYNHRQHIFTFHENYANFAFHANCIYQCYTLLIQAKCSDLIYFGQLMLIAQVSLFFTIILHFMRYISLRERYRTTDYHV